jgi:hypothetical protein
MSEQTARKLLDVIPAGTKDQDLRQLRQRAEQGLKAVTGAGNLNVQELEAVLTMARIGADQASPVVIRIVEHLRTAIPKLEALKARRQLEAKGQD